MTSAALVLQDAAVNVRERRFSFCREHSLLPFLAAPFVIASAARKGGQASEENHCSCHVPLPANQSPYTAIAKQRDGVTSQESVPTSTYVTQTSFSRRSSSWPFSVEEPRRRLLAGAGRGVSWRPE